MLFGVFDPNTCGFLGDANTPGTNDLSDLFVPGAIVPVPEPATIALWTAAGAAIVIAKRRNARLNHAA